MNEIFEMSCEQARESIQDLIDDGKAVMETESGTAGTLTAHLEACSDCRVFQEEMSKLHKGLTDLPELEFPAAALDEVWDQTVRKRPAEKFDWRWLAVAAAILIVVFAGRLFDPQKSGPEYSTAEVAQATVEARAALGLVRDALQRSEQAAVGRVLSGEVTPALEKITIGLPDTESSKKRRTGA
jgi:predicted anti-sigma-YlaC factor YlaD